MESDASDDSGNIQKSSKLHRTDNELADSDCEQADHDGLFDENWSFFECVVRGSVPGVEHHLANFPSLVNRPFHLSAASEDSGVSCDCRCWQFFEVGHEIEHLAGFYPGSVGWQSRVYPPDVVDEDDDDG